MLPQLVAYIPDKINLIYSVWSLEPAYNIFLSIFVALELLGIDNPSSISAFEKIYYYMVSFSEMVESMKTVAKLNEELTIEERNLLSVAYKNVIGARRASWRIITSIAQKEDSKGASVEMIKEYRSTVSYLFLHILFSLVLYKNEFCFLSWLAHGHKDALLLKMLLTHKTVSFELCYCTFMKLLLCLLLMDMVSAALATLKLAWPEVLSIRKIFVNDHRFKV